MNNKEKRGFKLYYKDEDTKISDCAEVESHFQMNRFLLSMIDIEIYRTEIDFSEYDDRYAFSALQLKLVKISYIINHSEEIFKYFEKLVENDPERKVTSDQIFRYTSKLITDSYNN